MPPICRGYIHFQHKIFSLQIIQQFNVFFTFWYIRYLKLDSLNENLVFKVDQQNAAKCVRLLAPQILLSMKRVEKNSCLKEIDDLRHEPP